MPTVTPAATFPLVPPYNTNPAYSGTFIPTLWSGKLNAKFYAHTMLSEIANTDWEGEIRNQGDMIRILTAPTITISDYKAGGNLEYEVPTPEYIDMLIDQGKKFGVQINDVLEYQSSMKHVDMFTEDAAKQMKIQIENDCFFHWFATEGPAAANEGAAAGAISGAFNLGSDVAPIDEATPENVLNAILRMSSVLDEQNVPEDGRWLIMSPYERNLLMASSLRQAYLTGDNMSTIRSGKIGMIDRFTCYVSNLLPRAAAGKAFVPALSDTATGATVASAKKRRMMVAGTRAACAFASQITKVEPLRNHTDFGDLVRGLNVYGRKVVKNTALVVTQVGSAT